MHPIAHLVPCPTCQTPMILRKGIYNYFYGCPKYVEKINQGENEFGIVTYKPGCGDSIPAEVNGAPYSLEKREAVRNARDRAHKVFDLLWKGGDVNRLMTRREAYKWLRKQLRIDREQCHIGLFDVDSCEATIYYSHDFLVKAQSGAIVRKSHARHTHGRPGSLSGSERVRRRSQKGFLGE